MSHNIFFNEQTGKYSFFSVKEKAWHGLGQIVEDYPTSAEAIKHAGLDYQVEKRNLVTDSVNEKEGGIILPELKVSDYFATVRSDTQTVLGVVGKDYQIVQNKDAFSFFDTIVGGEEGILYETAGALGKGERIFITAKLPGYINVGSGDLIEKYLFLTTSHDGSGSIMAAFTPIRIVCNNTLMAALRHCSNAIKIRHTSNAKERLEQAHKVMGIANQLSVELDAIFNQWSKIRITDMEVKKLIQLAMSPSKEVWKKVQEDNENAYSSAFKNTCEDVFTYGMMNETQLMETTKGTLFGAFNAITGYFQNVRNYKDDEAKVKSLLLGGTGALRTQKAFNLCLDFSRHGAEALN
jgi:phage/plasmid-like protein (TIGR03299 family)